MSMRSAAATVVLALFAVASEAGALAASPSGSPAEASRKNAPVPVSTNALRFQPWDATFTNVVTSEYEYHEPTNQSRNQQFGSQVSLSGDGRTMAVSDVWYFGGSEWPWYGSGAVYVYRLVSNTWRLEAKLEPPAARGYDFFGTDVALDIDGDTLAVGAQYEGYEAPSQDPGPGSVFVYKRRNGTWSQEARLRASRPQDNASFGRVVEISASGDVIAVGAPYEAIDVDGITQADAGAVYVFAKRAAEWTEQQALTAPNPQANDWFGWGVRLSEDGRTLAILAAEQNYDTEDFDTGGWSGRNNTLYVFERRHRSWAQAAELEGTQDATHFGGSMYTGENQTEGFDLSADGRILAVASPIALAPDSGVGMVQIYRRHGQHWAAAETTLTPTLPQRRSFGVRITLSADGRSLVAFADQDDGAYGKPYVVAFDYQRNSWQQTAIIEPSDFPMSSGWGNSLALSWSGRRLAVGTRLFSSENSHWGAVLVYGRQQSRSN
ncbi:MAG TPA: hypothetical protein VGE08_06230 [Steroidobacter sp.]|uniref:FG-GAP repeat protein n=1 Tax=Steroidobacter sp. TaxID=1978227 RepID=UPI002ED7DF9A